MNDMKIKIPGSNRKRRVPACAHSYESMEPRKLLAGDLTGWTIDLGVAANVRPDNVIVSQDDHVYVTGNFSGTFDFDPGSGVQNLTALPGGEGDGFVAKYTLDRELVWVNRLGGSGNERVKDVALDGSGNVYVAGEFDSADADFGSFSLTTFGQWDGFIAKLNQDGAFLWARQFGGSNNVALPSIGVNATGTIRVATWLDDSETIDLEFGHSTMVGIVDHSLARRGWVAVSVLDKVTSTDRICTYMSKAPGFDDRFHLGHSVSANGRQCLHFHDFDGLDH